MSQRNNSSRFGGATASSTTKGSRPLIFPEDAHAESSKPHKDDDGLEVQISEIPDSVLSNNLFP